MKSHKFKIISATCSDFYFNNYWYKSNFGYKLVRINGMSHIQTASITMDPRYDYTIYCGSDVRSLNINRVSDLVTSHSDYFIMQIRGNDSHFQYQLSSECARPELLIFKTGALHSGFTKCLLEEYDSWVQDYRRTSEKMSALGLNLAADYHFHHPIVHRFRYLKIFDFGVDKQDSLVLIQDGLATIEEKFGTRIS